MPQRLWPVGRRRFLDTFLIAFEFFTNLLRTFALGLCFLYVAYGTFNLGIRAAQHLLSLGSGLVDNLTFLRMYAVKFVLIPLYALLQPFLLLVYLLSFVLPVALVAADVLQILVGRHIFAPHDVGCLGNDLFGQTYLACYLDGKRAAGVAYAQLEQRLHLLAVVEHGSVHYTLSILCILLEVLIVCGDDSEGFLGIKPFQHRLGYRTTYLRLGAASELVDEDECGVVGLSHHGLHVEQM